jgi:hypothetical protein
VALRSNSKYDDDEAIFSVEVIPPAPTHILASGRRTPPAPELFHTILSPTLVLCLLILSFPGSASKVCAADVRQLGIAKVEYFIQTADEAPTYRGPGSFAFYAFVDQAATNSASAAAVNLPDARSEALFPMSRPHS